MKIHWVSCSSGNGNNLLWWSKCIHPFIHLNILVKPLLYVGYYFRCWKYGSDDKKSLSSWRLISSEERQTKILKKEKKWTGTLKFLKKNKSHDDWDCSVQFSSVTQSCPTLCDPMNRSTPGLPVHHQLQEFTQTHVHQVSDAIHPSHSLLSPSPPAPNPSQHQSLFQWVNSLHEVAEGLEFQL